MLAQALGFPLLADLVTRPRRAGRRRYQYM